MFRYSLLTAAALLSACGSNDDRAATETQVTEPPATATAPTAPTAAPGAPTDAAGYIAKAGAGDLWEIESSKALLAKSARADVKKFAEMMIDHHGKSTAKVKAAAAAASIKVNPPVLDASQQASLNEIKNADATTIDSVYLRHQQTAHDAALALHRAYATNGDTASLKTAAGEIAPVVEQHIAELQNLSGAAASNTR
ncbi:putative membrane protein [Sphingopyxis sp. OAS728]|uniref:DUF4142 domain-containing protein n=1 Tax=Sphingopyxis sp. OAS728 TaxID=2663823 RepID=UPI00178A67A8|nr:DUF4142 domain-containing protein [Sphingopyxis sp. OAS728]MBE1529871.1 putative membrane protein [Sphingopyxis sp. OAS728]